MRPFLRARSAVLLVLTFMVTTSCVNVFSPIDSPSGDEQILSAARAAFDRGDLTKAREYYEKLGGNEKAISEKLFLDLDACGAGIGALASALSKGSDSLDDPGILLTIMAEKMNPLHSTDCLEQLRKTYQASIQITDQQLRGFSRFLAALAIAGEVLAHNSGIATNGTFDKTDYLGLPSASCDASVPACSAPCAVTDGITPSAVVSLDTAPSIGATWGTLHGAVGAIITALDELEITSAQSGPLKLFKDLQTNGVVATNSAFSYRCLINSTGVGR